MSARVEWDGLRELMEALRKLPADLAHEAQSIVQDAAESAKTAAAANYPAGSTLAARLKVDRVDVGPFGTGARVVNTAPHAHMYENGTAMRQTALGWNRGAMPAQHAFVPPMQRNRTAMYEALKALLERSGLEVSGDA